MTIYFSSDELINMAIGIERSGIAFYDIMSKSIDNAATQSAFHYLADMEREHVKIFQAILEKAEQHQPSKNTAQEKKEYLQALVDNTIFTDEAITSEMASRADSPTTALELAIAAEKDSILFYYEIKEILSPQAKSTVVKIITEEKSHLWQLSELKKKLTEISAGD